MALWLSRASTIVLCNIVFVSADVRASSTPADTACRIRKYRAAKNRIP